MKRVDEEYLFWILLLQAYHAMSRVREQDFADLNITSHHATVLAIIHEANTGITSTEISKRMLRKSHTVSELINRMIRLGLVNKIPDSRRKNGVKLILTKKGETAYEKSREMKTMRRLISVFSQKHRKYLHHAFRLMRDSALNELRELKDNWIPPKLTDSS